MPAWGQNLVFTILGGLLTLLGGIATEVIRQRIAQKDRRRATKILLLEENDSLSVALDRLISNRKVNGTFLIYYLNEVTTIRAGYDRNRDHIIINCPDVLRKSVSSFYHKLLIACSQALDAENGDLKKPVEDGLKKFIEKLRVDLLADFQQLQAQLPVLRAEIAAWKI